MKKLSIIIPVYNEEKTLKQLINQVMDVGLENVKKEIIVIDDGSTDGSKEILNNFKHKIKLIVHDKNKGKGSAVISGLKEAKGDMILIQDADLEYFPKDYQKLIAPIISKEAQVVYGSRNINKNSYIYTSYYLGGKFLTFLINLLYNSKITDEATCYKVFDSKVIKNIPLKCQGFEFCPEVTVKLIKRGYNILEIPIKYSPRNRKEGKKIRVVDGFKAVFTIMKYRFFG